MSSVNLPPPPSALSGPDKEHLGNGSIGSSDRASPSPNNRKGQPKEPQPASGAPSPLPGNQSQQTKASNQPRNLPVKRFDGDPLGRADVQHAMLCHLFSDTRRVFTNPRPNGVGGAGIACPVWPYGMSAGCLRRSDETEEELKTWTETKQRYDKWRLRMDKKERRARKAAEAEARAAAGETQLVPEGGAETTANEETDELADPPADTTAAAKEAEEADDVDDETEPLDENEFVQPGPSKLTFKELYIEALLNSGKCTKSMRDKVLVDDEYAEDFAKVCLLVNVGRINTTLAFYPEMKTVLRSYHPLPSVQNNENTRRNMQDAPRMKSLLKAVLIDTERPGPPTAGPSAGQPPKPSKPNALSEEAPADFKEVIKRYRAGTVPPTSVVTLIFLFSLHANEVTDSHFHAPHDSHSLFYPHSDHPLPSKQRANAFLWLIYHYLEGPAVKVPAEQPNPFDDASSIASGKLASEAFEGLSEEQKKKRQNQPWKGIINPEWQSWKAAYEKQKSDANDATIRSTTGGRDSHEGTSPKKSGDDSSEIKPEIDNGDVSMEDVEHPASSGAEADAELGVEPISHTHRLLVPTLETCSYDEAAKENVDTPEEITWGKHMQSERATFLTKVQEEEAAKGAAASPAPSTASGKGKKGGGGAVVKRDDADRGTPSDAETSFTNKLKKRPSGIAGPSSGGGAGDVSKRSRMASPVDMDEPADTSIIGGIRLGGKPGSPPPASKALSSSAVNEISRLRTSLWDLDLSIPPTTNPVRESLPQLAWARILERAQRGVGDACYESDEEDFAEEEAENPEQSRDEVCRIIMSLREVVREDIFEEDNRLFREKHGKATSARPVQASSDAEDSHDDGMPAVNSAQRNGPAAVRA